MSQTSSFVHVALSLDLGRHPVASLPRGLRLYFLGFLRGLGPIVGLPQCLPSAAISKGGGSEGLRVEAVVVDLREVLLIRPPVDIAEVLVETSWMRSRPSQPPYA